MNKQDAINKLIFEFWERDLDEVKERKTIPDLAESELVNDLVGIRRAGKTFFMYFVAKKLRDELGREQFIYLNCEHRSIYPLKLEDLNYLIDFIHRNGLAKDKRVFLMLDEVQTVSGWEVFVKSVYEEFGERIKILVSGSVKHLLSEDYGRLLSGRHKTIRIFPLSFREYLSFKGCQPERVTGEVESKIKKFAEDYMMLGSFPKYVLSGDQSWLEETFDDIIERDVKSRADVKKKIIIDELAALLLERSASRMSFTKIRNILNGKGYSTSTDLVIKYCGILDDVFLFSFLPAYSQKYSEIVKSQKKAYVADNGFLAIRQPRFSENAGTVMESCVFNELVKLGWEPGKSLFYYKSKFGESEVDFVLKEGLNVKQLIQATAIFGKEEVEKRETDALLKASDELKCDNLLVITREYDDKLAMKNKKIAFMPLWKWLLTDRT